MYSYRCQRVGHGGASALVAANTLASFDAALSVGVDMIEFDVRAYRGELILAHTIFHARCGRNVRLGDALAYLSTPPFREIELNVDLKHPGCESALLAELHHWRLLERTLISSQVPEVLDRVRELDQRARVGISVGNRIARLSRRWRDWRGQVLEGLASHRWDALMAQHRLVDSELLEEVAARRALLYAWTVDERVAIQRLLGLGVHGIATGDPRLFA
jgi:glycerophosphoryl diester phosphodiesterase